MSGTYGVRSTAPFEADPSADWNGELASAVRKVLPYVTSHRFKLLMEKLDVLGVRCEGEMAKVKESDLQGTVSSHEAKKLLAFFTEQPTEMDDVFSEGARHLADIEALEDTTRPNIFTEEDERAITALRDELPRTLNREHEKRKDIHDATLMDIDNSMSGMSENHDATIEEMKRSQAVADRAHKKMLQDMEKEERRRAEIRQKERLEFEQRLREQNQKQTWLPNLLQGAAQLLGNVAGNSSRSFLGLSQPNNQGN